jgi:outer membrane protein OmpA-like peptidoglycan-associated protein
MSIALTACVSQNTYDKVEAENTLLKRQVAAQSAEVERKSAEAAAQTAQVKRLQGAIKHTVEADLVFAPGSWELTPEGKDVISKMAAKLAPTQHNKLVVHGYTDSEPIGPGLERRGVTSNEILSKKRADAVRQYLISQGFDADLISTRGHGEANPVSTNETAEGRSQNRRVELTLEG